MKASLSVVALMVVCLLLVGTITYKLDDRDTAVELKTNGPVFVTCNGLTIPVPPENSRCPEAFRVKGSVEEERKRTLVWIFPFFWILKN